MILTTGWTRILQEETEATEGQKMETEKFARLAYISKESSTDGTQIKAICVYLY